MAEIFIFVVSELLNWDEGNLHEYISGKSAIMLRNRPGSERVGYALKMPRTPTSKNEAYRGSYLISKH